MKKNCPKCHSEEIEEFNMAELYLNCRPTKFKGVEDPTNYRCTKCDWMGEIKE